MKLFAVILDFDGTIIDSNFAWKKAFTNVLTNLGLDIPKDDITITGASLKDNWDALISKYNLKIDKTFEELRSFTYNEYKKLIPGIGLIDGASEFIENLKYSGAQVALATNTSWEVVDEIIKNLEIEHFFDYITTGDEVLYHKPDPEIYIKAAEKMNLEPVDCLVIENTEIGVRAAKEAGMKVVAISTESENSDSLSQADLVVEGYSEITSQAIDQI